MEMFINLLISGALTGIIYGLTAMGFVLVYKCSSIFNFAQGALLLIGAYICWPFLVAGFPLWCAIPISMILSFALGMLIQNVGLRRLIGESILALVMATVALSEIIRGVTMTFWGSYPLKHVATFPTVTLKLGTTYISGEHIWAAGISLILVIIFMIFFYWHRLGLAMRGAAEGHIIVQSMGINPNIIIGYAWGIAAAVAALTGVSQASISGFSTALYNMGLKAIPAAFVGGLQSVPGAFLGGIIIGEVEMLFTGYIGRASGTAAAFLVLVIVMVFKPYGLFGLERIERV
jgi:branched-chain amino acid transport system permease protein